MSKLSLFFEEELGLSSSNLQIIKRLVCRSKGAVEGDLIVLRDGLSKAGTTAAAVLKNKVKESVPILSSKQQDRLNNPILLVDDTHDFVEKYILYKRKEFPTKWIFITGSVGKTTTSYMLHKILQKISSSYYARQGNIYSAICSSACLLDEKKAEYAIFETAQGALPEASAKFHPDVSLYISLSPAHMERHADLKSLAICKAAVFEGGRKGDKAIINRDIEYYDLVESIAHKNNREVISYGNHEKADFKIIDLDTYQFTFKHLNKKYTVKQEVVGKHISLNFLSIISTLHALGYSWENYLDSIGNLVYVPRGRGNIVNYSLSSNNGKVIFIDQSYNATPLSMYTALKMLKDYPSKNRKIAVLSDMLELGVDSDKYHTEVVNTLMDIDLDLVVTCGEILNRKIVNNYNKKYISFSCIEDVFSYLDTALTDGDIVMVKGSNGTGLNKSLKEYIY